MPRLPLILLCIACATLILQSVCGAQEARLVDSPPRDQRSPLYTGNREPLAPSPLIKLPIGSIEPKGWLREMLDTQRKGMVGHLPEISRWCNFEGNAWADPQGAGHSGWEEMPYWLKGYGDLGYVLKDEQIIAHTKKWIDSILATQREDGWFGPRGLLTSLDKARDGTGGRPDLWPNMIVLNILQSYHEVTADPRIIPFMTRYARWQLDFPENDFMAGYWPKMRIGDNIESVYWLYNRTGDKWLLDLASKIHRTGARWDRDVINWHGVNITQGFRTPTIYWMQSGEKAHLEGAERNYQKVMGLYGQVPGGMFGADENARPGFGDPRQGAETCSMVEFMHSFEMLTKITGNPIWADRCEEVAFNSLPAASTPDQRALHYLTGANQVQLDRANKAPGIENRGTMFSYSPFEVYRCCQHNVAHGWPYYAEELYLATSDKGLAVSLYAASTVTAKVADGQTVTITQETHYPFSETISLKLSAERPVRFPLYLRLPRWADGATLSINTRPVPVPAKPLSYLVLEQEWKEGDVLTLTLPMKLAVRRWEKNHNSISVDHGPLTFSLKIGEKWQRYGRPGNWAEFEVHPTTPWNYGLVVDPASPAGSFQVERRPGPVAANPFTHDTAPITIKAKARKIPQWTTDANGLINTLQPSPAKTNEPVEEITLIPMGAARLRISAFPTVTDGADGHEWKKPTPPQASHCFDGDTVLALNDGKLPRSSSDPSIPRFTWWDHKGTTEWVQYDFDQPRTIKQTDVYWYDDTGRGQCRPPASWRILYKAGDEWKEVQSASGYGVELNKANRTTFEPVQTTAVRLEARLQPNVSAGILEWQVQ